MNKKYIGALKEVVGILEKNDVKYALCAGANLSLQGVDVDVGDIDISVPGLSGVVRRLFSAYGMDRIRYIQEEDKYNLNFSVLGVDVDLFKMSGIYNEKTLDENSLTTLDVFGTPVRAFTLEAEIECYSKTFRQDKADLISRYFTEG